MDEEPTDRSKATWRRIGTVAGTFGALGLLTETALYMLDQLDVLTAAAVDHEVSSFTDDDAIAANFAAYFEHQHAILWDIVVRDTVGPAGYLALGFAAVALVQLLGRGEPMARMFATLLVVGTAFSAFSDLVFLGSVNYWRYDGWDQVSTANMLATGRAVQALDNVTTYPQDAGYLAIAVSLFCLWRWSRTEPRIPRSVSVLALAEAVVVPLAVLFSITGPDAAYYVVAIASGLVLGPLVALGLARAAHHAT